MPKMVLLCDALCEWRSDKQTIGSDVLGGNIGSPIAIIWLYILSIQFNVFFND